MKKFRFIIIAAAAIALSACSKYDDSALVSKISALDERVTSLEAFVNRLNKDVTSIQNILDAAIKGSYITEVVQETDGYKVVLSDGSSFKVFNGKNGTDGTTPVIGAKQFTDGIYYWTVNDEWLLDASGNKISVQGVTPQFRMSGVYLQVSYDGGKNWSTLCEISGGGTTPAIKEVIVSDDFVYFTLADDSVISLPRTGSVMSIDIAEGEIVYVSRGATVTVNYSVTNAPDDAVKVSAIAGGNWSAKVTPATSLTGTIDITAPEMWADGEILVFAYSKNLVAMTSIICKEGGETTKYYTLDLSGVNWSASNVHYVKDQSSSVIAMVTKEYFGGTVNKQGVVVYPAPEGTPDYTKGFVAELTLDGGSAVSGNVHGGSVSFTTMKADDVVYTAGTTSAVSTVYVIDGGQGIAAEAPAGTNLGTGALEPLTVVTDVKSHPCTKTGIDIWMAENYQTTKFVDGTDIPKYKSGDPWPTNTAAKGKVVIVYDDATYGTQYLYSEWAMGYTSELIDGIVHGHFDGSNFAPEGWHVPSSGELLTDLFGFMGSSTWENMSGQGLMNWNLTAKANNDADMTVSMLAYGSIWTSSCVEGKTTSYALMCGPKPENKTVNSQQKVRNAFCARLIMD